MKMKARARQFSIASKAFDDPDLVLQASFGGLHVRHHTDLEVCKAGGDGREGLLLGNAVDPARPEQGNQQIINRLVTRCLTFFDLEQDLAALGGRWVLLFRISGHARLYPDAGGTKSTYYSADGRIASQPGCFGHAVDNSLGRYPHAGAWPLGYTPFPGVHQLLPNHYLDLSLWKSVRFGPRTIKHRDIDSAVDTISMLLRGSVQAVALRGHTALPLTGGFDSRTLLSATIDTCLEEIELFSILDHKTPRHDYVLPQVLARRLGKPLRFVNPGQPAPLELNTCGMFRDPNSERAVAFAQAEHILLGHLSEITRCFYWKDGVPPEVTPERLSRLAGFGGELSDVFQGWLDNIPTDYHGSILDLFYWECRAGNWASNCCTALDGFCSVVSPYNCRDLLETGLGVDVAYRCKPYRMHRRLCSDQFADIPFNTTLIEDLESRLPRWFPWRLRMKIRHIGRPAIH